MYQTAPYKQEITAELRNRVPRFDESLKSVLTRNGIFLEARFYDSGIFLRARVRNNRAIDVRVLVPREYDGQTRGLLGLLDGNPENDFRTRNGVQLSGRISRRNLYYQYVDSCKFFFSS